MEVIIVNSALRILLFLSSFCRPSSLQQLKKNTVVPASCFTFHDFWCEMKRESKKVKHSITKGKILLSECMHTLLYAS